MSEIVRYHTGKFPPKKLDVNRLLPLITPASGAIHKFDGLLQPVPNSEVLLAPLSTTEATSSCRIEGTQVTDEEVWAADAGSEKLEDSPGKKKEILEAQNYRRALKRAVEIMNAPDRPKAIYSNVLKSAHAILLDDQEGLHKHPGEYRRGGVSVGSFCPIEAEYLAQGMYQWEQYINNKDVPDPLIQLAITHVEFESLHPFEDGNGRMGRMLVPLFLYDRELLSAPTFYLSEYLEEHRREYFDRLREVSRADDWTGWCEFFLKAITEQGKRNGKKAKGILDLYDEKKDWMKGTKGIGLKETTMAALDFFFQNVEFNPPTFMEKTKIKEATGRRLLNRCRDHGLLICTKEPKGRTPGFYRLKELRELIE